MPETFWHFENTFCVCSAALNAVRGGQFHRPFSPSIRFLLRWLTVQLILAISEAL
jgi:hypothetical protein